MDLVSHVTLLGGACDRAALLARCGRAAVDQALKDQVIVRLARGRYALPSAHAARRTASAHSGVVSHRSAAQLLGWGMKDLPELPDVTFPRNRRVSASCRAVLQPHWAVLQPGDVELGCTSVARTLYDCLRSLPFEQALPIADSALRAGDVTPAALVRLAARVRGPGRRVAGRVAIHATSRAANPFESVLRAIAVDVPGLDLEPQLPVRINRRLTIHPDLGDASRRLAVEAEGFAWHGDAAALTRDCVRYNALALAGWTVIRFSWVLVMHQPAYIRSTLERIESVLGHADAA